VDPLRQASHLRFDVCDRADVGALRRLVCEQARRLGATQEGCARAELVATELGTNLVEHAAPGGWVLVRAMPPASLELIAADRGPGIADPAAAVAGRSRAPTGLGCGLAAVRRAAAHFDLHSQTGRGTTVLAVVALAGAGQGPGGAPAGQGPGGSLLGERPGGSLAGASQGRGGALAGQRPGGVGHSWAGVSVGVTEPCGDAWAVTHDDQGFAVAVADGLGHGAGASTAADAAAAGFAAARGDPASFLARANAAMLGTRGGAATVCQLLPGQGILRYVAVGNVNGCVLAGSARHRLITYSGTLGLRDTPPVAKVLACPWPARATLVVWTDGLHSRAASCAMDAGLLARDPAVIAATLYRDHLRGSDDATVVIVRNEQA
jgi:anti-sigma regulatory factor (Ser/Thr protein kinase)